MAAAIINHPDPLDWLDLVPVDEGQGGAEVRYTVNIAGPAIAGRDPQPYEGGIFTFTAAFPSTFPAAPPAFTICKRLWHPLVHWDTLQLCAAVVPELWPSYAPSKEALAALDDDTRKCEPMLAAFRLLRDLLAKVHENTDGVAVNSEAVAQIKADGGKPFDVKASETTRTYAMD